MNRLFIRSWMAGVALAVVVNLSAHAGSLRVGTGKASVTPAAADFPYEPSEAPSLNTGPGELSFVGVHDDIYARAVVLDDGSRRAALVVLEVTAIPGAEDMVKAIASEVRIPAANVMLAATHTHSVPLFSYAGSHPSARERREIDRLKAGALEAVRAANSHLQPARVAFGRGQSWVNINNGEQSGSRAGYDALGPSDKTLDVIRFESLEGAPLAEIVNYASHAEVMFRSVTKDHGYEVSGDLPGAVSRLLEKEPEGAPLVLFTSGAEADQLTLFKSLQPAGRLPGADEGAAGWGLLDVQARRLTASVLGVTGTMQPGTTEVQIRTESSSVTCPGQQIRINPDNGQTIAEAKPPVTIPLSMIRINDIVLAGVGGDVASEIGQHFKKASPVADSTMITMAGDSVGYVFADASYVHPGHGLTKSPLKAGCAEPAIVDGLVRMTKATNP